MFIVGRISTKEIVEVSPKYGQKNPTKSIVLHNIIINHGGMEIDYDVFYFSDESEECKRIMDRNSFELIWDNDKITEIDFTTEDNKQYLSFEVNKKVISKNKTDNILMVGKILLSDATSLDTTFNDTLLIPIQTPTSIIILKAKFKNGICNHNLVTEQYGTYKYPANNKYVEELKVLEQITIDSVFEVIEV